MLPPALGSLSVSCTHLIVNILTDRLKPEEMDMTKRTPKKAIPLKAIPINWWIDGERSTGGSPYNCSI